MSKETKQTILAYLLLLLVVVGMLMSCTRTVYVPGETKTEYVVQERVDSLIMHDSVYIREVINGDTVYLKEVRYRDREHIVTRYDTIRSTDTVKVPVPIPEPYPVIEVDHQMNTFQKTFFWIGIVASIFIIIYCVNKIRPGWLNTLKELLGKLIRF